MPQAQHNSVQSALHRAAKYEYVQQYVRIDQSATTLANRQEQPSQVLPRATKYEYLMFPFFLVVLWKCVHNASNNEDWFFSKYRWHSALWRATFGSIYILLWLLCNLAFQIYIAAKLGKFLQKVEKRQLLVQPFEWLKLNFATCVVHQTRSHNIVLVTEQKKKDDFLSHNRWFWFLGFGDRWKLQI